MNCPILIPSRGRTHLLGTVNSTITQFDNDLLRRTVYFVPYDEVDAYRLVLPGNVNVIGVDYSNIGEKRRKMAEWADDTFFMADDDLRWFVRQHDESVKLVRADASDLHVMLEVAYSMSKKYAVVGISAREGNNTVGVGRQIQLNTRIHRAGMFDRAAFLSVEHGRTEYKADFDVLLQLLRSGRKTVNLYQWCTDQGQTQAAGGCSLHRTHERNEEAARRLAELHPGFVKLVEKNNKTGGEFGRRTEVRISWKQAYLSSIR